MEWSNLATSALNDLLRDELVQSFIDDANAAIKYHRANAAQFAEMGNHESAMVEMAAINEQRRIIANWREALEVEARS